MFGALFSSAEKSINIKEYVLETVFDVFTGGSQPQGHLPQPISDGFGQVLSTIRDPGNLPLCAIPVCAFLAPFGNGVRRLSGGSRPQDRHSRLTSDGYSPCFVTNRGPGLYFLLSVKQPFYIFVFGSDQESATK